MFKGIDYYDIESELSDRARQVRDTAREFVEREFMPVIREHYRAGTFPVDLVPRMGELGMLGAGLSGYGLPGMDSISYGLMMQELERGDSGLRSFASVQGALVMYPILAFGSEAQKSRWLPSVGERPGHRLFRPHRTGPWLRPGGNDASAVKEGDDYILNGTKMWITNGTIADVALVWAKLDGEIRGFLVERGTPGFSAREITGKLSLRASNTGTLILDKARVPEENLLPEAVRALRPPSRVSTRPATASPGGRSARPWPVSRRRWPMPAKGRSSAGRLRRTSLPRPSWPTCSPKSPRVSSWPCSSRASRKRDGCARNR